jgi:hypothetical protein
MAITKINYQVIEDQNLKNYINIIREGQSLSDIGWATYSDTAGINPVDGIGGTASITWGQNISNPLSGSFDFRLVKDESNRQGNGVSIPFTIANRHLAKVLQISFDMELISGTYASGDLRVSVIQEPSGTPILIEPVNTNIQLGIANQRIKHIATFQSHSSITSYRLCIHVSSTSASAYTVDFSNFEIWEPTQSVGSVITDWIQYVPSSAITNGTINFKYKRSGSDIILNCAIFWTGTGSLTFTVAQILPAGLSVDTAKLGVVPTNNLRSAVGFGYHIDSGVSNSTANFLYDSSNNTIYTLPSLTTPSSGDSTGIEFVLPVLGWGSSVAMSSDSGDSRLVSAIYTNHGTTATVGGTNGLRYSTLLEDTHSIYNTANGAITIPISGTYQIKCSAVNSSGTTAMYLWRSRGGGAITKVLLMGVCATVGEHFEAQLNCLSGDILYVSANTSVTFTPSALPESYISIFRISTGSQLIANTEDMNIQYTTVSNSHNSSNSSLDLVYATRVKDSHGSYNTTTGIFTAPMSGCYDIEAQVVFSANATGYRAIVITNTSNTNIARGTELNANTFLGNLGMASVSFKSYPMLAGQQIKIRYFQNSGGTLALSSDSTWNRLSITRVGNF